MPVKKSNFRKAREALKKAGGLKKVSASKQQLERLCKTIHIKYVITLEDQLTEDKAHLYCKESTISTLQRELDYLRNKLQKIELFEEKRARILNNNELEWGHKLKEYVDANDDLAAKNKILTADHIEITRAYNSLQSFGIMAQEQGINIRKHREKLPENQLWDFKATQEVLESGKVINKIKATKKKVKKK